MTGLLAEAVPEMRTFGFCCVRCGHAESVEIDMGPGLINFDRRCPDPECGMPMRVPVRDGNTGVEAEVMAAHRTDAGIKYDLRRPRGGKEWSSRAVEFDVGIPA